MTCSAWQHLKLESFRSLLASFFMFVVSQAEEHPLFLQHHPGGAHLACLHRPIPDGQKHLVFRGEPLLQIPLLLQSLLHHEIMRLGEGGRQQSGGRRNEEVLGMDDERCRSSKPFRWYHAVCLWSLHRHLRIKWNHKTRGHRWSYWTSAESTAV